ncbi:MAG: hypothetical protein ABIQ01_08265 [Pseudolysinimonas sp.]
MSHIRRSRRIIAWAFAVVGAFAVGVLVSWMWWSATVSGGGQATADTDHPNDVFTISGDLTEPVSPGVMVPLNLSITNPNDDDLLVTVLTVRVASVDAPDASQALPCDTGDYAVDQLSLTEPLRLGGGATSTLEELGLGSDDWPRVGMIDASTNQDGCKGASLVLEFTASGGIDR